MNRIVTYARLQTEAYIPGTGGLGTVFPPPGKTLENLVMTALDSAMYISFNYKGIARELLVPYGNVVLMELSPIEVQAKNLKALK